MTSFPAAITMTTTPEPCHLVITVFEDRVPVDVYQPHFKWVAVTSVISMA